MGAVFVAEGLLPTLSRNQRFVLDTRATLSVDITPFTVLCVSKVDRAPVLVSTGPIAETGTYGFRILGSGRVLENTKRLPRPPDHAQSK